VSQKVSRLKNSETYSYKWLQLSIAVLACSLTLSLATRFSNQFTSQVHNAHAVERRSVEPKKQYPSPDTVCRREMVVGPAVLATVSFSARVVSARPVPVRDRLDDRLYNRPPPPFGLNL
jgi:hypothetical protein